MGSSYVRSAKSVKLKTGSASRRWRREQERLEKKNQIKKTKNNDIQKESFSRSIP